MRQNARLFKTVDDAVEYVRVNMSLSLPKAQAFVEQKTLIKNDNFLWVMTD
tara:strand:+ start:858 stop:1010 length:153 start_codon:yes stop_codon:yes gene_type:complete